MLLRNILWKTLNCAVAFISMEDCRNCKNTVDNRHPLKSPQSLCSLCWRQLKRAPAVAVAENQSSLIVAAGIYSGLLRKLIIKLKQSEDPLLAEDLSELVIKNAAQFQFGITIQRHDLLVVPMPLHKNRLCRRGFNQSALLARALSSSLNLRLSTGILCRTRDTRSQRGLHKEERRTNVQGAFAARSDQVMGKTIILVDDVRTSGATMQAAAHALFDAGAADVIETCVAIAPLLYRDHL